MIPHFPYPDGEIYADVVLGKVDAVEIRNFTPSMQSSCVQEWYRLLNCGYRVAAVGGTDKMGAGMPLGGVRTYAEIGNDQLSLESWARAVRAGRTFTTSGPFIGLSVDGAGLGDVVHLPRGGGTLDVEAWADSAQPIHELDVVVNGEVVSRHVEPTGTLGIVHRCKLHVQNSSWIAVRCVSSFKTYHSWPVNIAAHT